MSRTADADAGAGWLMLFALVAWVAAQGWLLHAHWINPDEGAHLMDSRLAMEGLIPKVDYGSRQPLYTLAYTPFLRWFGGGYVSGRLMPLAATLITGWVLWLIGRRLWGVAIGRSAAVLYLFAPSILINASIVKMEPLAILVMSLGMYGLIVHQQQRRWWPLFLAGAAFGAGYYVRESTLAGVVAATLVVLFGARDGLTRTLGRLAALFAGYAAVCGGVVAWYARHLPLGTVLSDDGLFPFAMLAGVIGPLAGSWGAAPEVAAEPIRQSAQSWSTTATNLTDALRLNLPYVTGVVAAACAWIWTGLRRFGMRQEAEGGRTLGLMVPALWLGCVAVLYTYHILHRGFFQYYGREFIAPMALLLAFVLGQAVQRLGWERHQTRILMAALVAGLGVFVLQRSMEGGGVLLSLVAVGGIGWAGFRRLLVHPWQRIGYLTGILGLIVTAGVLRLTQATGWAQEGSGAWWPALGIGGVVGVVWASARRLEWARVVSFIAVAAIAVAGISTASYAAQVLTPAYDCVWSPGTVSQVAAAIARHSEPGDEVLSGAVIWEFEARRRPFMRITHPLSFLNGMESEEVARMTQRLSERPPQVIVLDGYTERTHLPHVSRLEELLASSYVLTDQVEGSRYPVGVYVLRAPIGMTEGRSGDKRQATSDK